MPCAYQKAQVVQFKKAKAFVKKFLQTPRVGMHCCQWHLFKLSAYGAGLSTASYVASGIRLFLSSRKNGRSQQR